MPHKPAADELADLAPDNVLTVLAKLYAGTCRAHPDDDAQPKEFDSAMAQAGHSDLWLLAERENPAAAARRGRY
jgi:hypothetical protein